MAATYTVLLDVSDRLVGTYPSGFSATTKPDDTRVQAWLDETEDVINQVLLAVGLGPTPYTAAAAKSILRTVTADVVEGRVRQTLASAGGDGANDDGKALIARLDTFTRDLQVRTDHWGDVLAGGASGSKTLSTHVADHVDGTAIGEPAFTITEVF